MASRGANRIIPEGSLSDCTSARAASHTGVPGPRGDRRRRLPAARSRHRVADTSLRHPAKGLAKTWDHWLFLAVAEGCDEVIPLHDALYSGILLPYLRTEQPYVPQVGLGHFAQEHDTHDPLELRARTFDRARYDEARREAETLQLDYSGRLDRVHIFGLDEDLTHVARLEEIPLA